MPLDLSAEERDLLVKVLERALAELRVEVRRTSTPAYHDDLQAEEGRLKELLDRIRALEE